MPLIHIPPEPPAPPPRTWPKVPTPPGKTVSWTGPDGATHLLSGGDYTSLTGRRGFGVIQPDHVASTTMSGAGWLRDIRLTPRLMSVPLLIQAADPDSYLAAYRALQASVVHKRGGHLAPGVLRVTLPDGSWREIACYYRGGLDPHEDTLDDMMWSRQEHTELEFWAPDPAFVGPVVEQAWRIVAPPRRFYPLYPVTVTSSQLGGSATVTSPGDLDSYPVWEVTGPGAPTITDMSSGREWGFTTPLAPGQRVTVDCRPPDLAPETGLTAVDSTGEDWWPNFSGDTPDLWHLPPGRTDLQIAVAGATEDTRVSLAYRPRYQAGW